MSAIVESKRVAGLTFDFSGITARQAHEYFGALRRDDIMAIAEYFASGVVVNCPFGDARNPETYANLPFYGEFQDLLIAYAEASKNARKS
jgi:hypothetical protein